MEKRTPHCRLDRVKTLIAEGKVRVTGTALRGAASLGLDVTGMIAVVNSLNRTDFYKSMTTHADHQVWQDVYRPTTSVGQVYLKLTVIDDVLIVSFKALENES
ncbi:MAG: type II toxin-antitoxin system MqsR family toxin [Fluviicoccus sp.]|uniref:type II toxin-antitoxin system MqsR family toxin n=1 Tax=Fluviicoccus sp. TaxID=2003552 RepID=UPI00272307E4|nr:type II toxin-antitoxin system MqsR family toxin [Fluviicoccus sp.]MDO8329509.1 type II toxin-antitoxin system MqsR family toxin [Fluviicoccus sp.]